MVRAHITDIIASIIAPPQSLINAEKFTAENPSSDSFKRFVITVNYSNLESHRVASIVFYPAVHYGITGRSIINYNTCSWMTIILNLIITH